MKLLAVPKSQAVRISNQLVVQKLSAVLLRTMHHRIPSHQAAPQSLLLTQTFYGQTNSMAPPSITPIGVLKLATAAGAITNGNTTPTVQKTPTSKTESCIFVRLRKTSKQRATRRPALLARASSVSSTGQSKPVLHSPWVKGSGLPSGCSAITSMKSAWPACGEIDIIEAINDE